jgi:hypothetical protein
MIAKILPDPYIGLYSPILGDEFHRHHFTVTQGWLKSFTSDPTLCGKGVAEK